MNQQGAARGHEDDWWRQLYGDGDGSAGGSGSGGAGAGEGASGRRAVCDAGPSDVGPSDVGPSGTTDTLDDRVASALRTLRGPRRADPAPRVPRDRGTAAPPPGEPPGRPASSPPEPSAPIPLRSTGSGKHPPSAERPAPGLPLADRPPVDDSCTDDSCTDDSSTDDSSTDRRTVPPPRTPQDTPPPTAADPFDPADPDATGGPTGDRPSSPAADPGELPAADPAALDDLVPDTTLDGARYGALTLRAVSQRGDAARRRGDLRRDALLTARFGSGRHALILVAVATGRPSAEGAHRAARDACTWIGGAVGRSYTRLAEDIRTDRRGALKSGLQRLTDRSYGTLRGRGPERGAPPERHPAALRCLLLPADPDCRTRVFFGVGAGGLFLLRDGAWQDLEPAGTARLSGKAAGTGRLPRPAQAPAHDPHPNGSPARPEPFLFRTAFARPGDTLLLCTAGLAEPLREEPAFAARLADRWSADGPPGLVDFLTAAQLRAEDHPKDRTAVGVWES
ncbi:protein phosphatase 2C domain-containing protein [Streptomyces sp. DSM 41527]|uniref:Protein phosphatase 2C domain-containing protein n=1 Tax=Streptomyces mooreae TaxID=3075523 RepID=A0ABU2T439_9ACTN|nr:protein phosphatase 2C domain-containing protein [Streptomyces sp. DSM 41527]MDT0455991.1 protein phosphatase 2C domain-containing protein [Streptomyces sp. DSM 41527]